MYGYQPPAARRLAQLPGQYADGGAVGFGSRGLSQLRDMIPKVQAMGYQQAAPAPAAPSAADRLRTLIPQMEAMGYKQQPQYLARGGMVRGPGTGTSDSIETEAEPGTFIMPADSTKALGKSALEKLATVPVKLSNGEFEFPPEQVMAVGAAVLKLLKDTTHKPVNGEDGGQTDDEAGEGPGHEMAEAMPGGQEDDAEEDMGYRPADRMAMMPPMMFADGGMVAPRRMDIGQWAQGMEQWRGEQAIADARQAKAFQDQADADEYARQQAEASKLRDQQQAGGAQPQLGFADGGMVENDITRVGNSYSGGNVGGNVSINGQTGGGTVSTTSWTSPVPAPAPTPVATAAPTAQQPAAAPATTAATPAPAPAPAAPMGWAERNAQRSAQVTASSIMDSPDRRAAQAKLAAPTPPPPSAVPAPVAGGFQTASQRLGSFSDPRSSLYDPNPYAASNAAKLSAPMRFQPRRYADGGIVQDEERAQRLAQLPSGEAGGDGGGGGAGGATGSWHLPEPAKAAPNGALSRAASMAPASAPAPAPAAGYATAAQRLGSVPDSGTAEPAMGFQRRGPAEAMALMPNAPQLDVRAPIVRHSGNDWQARKDLENAKTSASSIMNRPDWSGAGMNRFRGGQSGPPSDVVAYQAMLANDLALRSAQPGMDQAAMRENSESGRAVLRDRGETMRTGLQVAAQGDQASADREAALARVLIGERGANSRAGITAQAATEAARIKALQDRKAPDGYRYKGDGNLEAIPGGPAAGKVAEEQKTKDSALDASRQTIGTINRLLASPGREGATGLWNLNRFIPGNQSADFAAEVETLKAQTFLPMVQQLRGMGALSNAEGEKLNAAVGALNFNMSEKAFAESLGRIRDQFGSVLQRSGVDTKDMANWGLEAPTSAAEQGARGPGASAPAPALPGGMTRQVGTSGGRPVYEDAQGNRFIGG